MVKKKKEALPVILWTAVMQDTERRKKKQKTTIGKENGIETMRDCFSPLHYV